MGSVPLYLGNIWFNFRYCGPSPDEISLLESCKDVCRFFFIGADSSKVVIQTLTDKFEVEKLIMNEFESDRKMMSVLIKYNNRGGSFYLIACVYFTNI